jgi:hypothetical protein
MIKDNCLESSCIGSCSTFSIAIFRHSSRISFGGYNEVEHICLCQKTELEEMYNFSGTLETQRLMNRKPICFAMLLRRRSTYPHVTTDFHVILF